MSVRYVGCTVPVVGPLGAYADGFAAVLAERGYSVRTIETQLRMVRDVSEWLGRGGVSLDAWSGEVTAEYVACRQDRTATLRSAAALAPLVDYLRGLGVVPVAAEVASPDVASVLLAEFASFLAAERGVAAATVRSYIALVRPLVEVEVDRLAMLDLEAVEGFIDGRAKFDRPRSVQVRINAVRALLRWLWRSERIGLPLHEQVASMFVPGGPPPSQGLTSTEVDRLFVTLSAGPVARLRDRALVTLMVRLGLRAGEVAALRLESLSWREGTIIVNGKRRRIDVVPMPCDVGEALVAYLRRARPTGTAHREVFLAVDAPHGPIGSAAVGSVAGRAMRRAGITPGGAHRLRHTAAMRIVAGGGGLVEAGQLLRHTSVTATAIYARADVAALAELTRPWPGASK